VEGRIASGVFVPYLEANVERPADWIGSDSDIVGIVLAGAYPALGRIPLGSVPRPLLPVAQVPVIGHVLHWLREGGITRATVCANAASREVGRLVGDGSAAGLRIALCEDAMPRGPAGSARDAALAYTADTFVVADGTVIPNFDLRDVIDAHRASGAAVTAVVHYAQRGSRQGPCLATPAGVYVFARRSFEAVPASGFQDVKEHLLPALRRRHERVGAYVSRGSCPRVLNVETYLAVNHWMIDRLAADQALLEERWAPISLTGQLMAHPSADVHPTATTIGPVLLGPRVTVGPNTVIVGPTSIGTDTQIGEGAAVCRAVIWRNSRIGEHVFVDASVIGDNVTIAPGTTLHTNVTVHETAGDARRKQQRDVRLRPAAVGAGGSMVDLATP
jgi:NDP-sugar pyrophosphorylase family protein